MAGFPRAGDEYGGRYRIVRQLGHGGMGIVYEAVDKVLDRSVALKIVLPSLPDRENYQARFAREASVLARIRSRNIVGIHEYGEHEDTVYFVTELFPDGDLQSWLAQHGPLDRRAALSLVAQVCEALADAHATGVIHRDVKPGNVLLWSRPEGLIPYLCDFGIAIDGAHDERAGLTRTGTLIGSPAYMAPERHFGHEADERGDVYSLGCLLWAVLTGDAPFSGTDFQMMNSHINASVPQLATGHPVDDRIDEVLAGALNKDPERRTPSATALRAALLGIIRDIDAQAVPAPLPPAPGPGTGSGSGPVEDRTRATGVPTELPAEDHTRATELPAEVPVEPAAARQDTVIRDLPAVPPATRPQRPAPPAPRATAWLPAALVAGGVAVAIGATAFVVAASRGDAEPAANPPATTTPSETPTPTPTAEPLVAPKPPKVTARPGYRSVTFTLAAPRAVPGTTQHLEVNRGQGWQRAVDHAKVPTKQGGERGCLTARTVVGDDTGREKAGRPVRSCGRAEPRTVRLVRTADSCTAGAGCHWYDVHVAGFATGTAPQAFIYDSAGHLWCDCTFRRVHVGKDGHGAQIHEWQVTPGRFNSYVTLVVDGVRQRVFVP